MSDISELPFVLVSYAADPASQLVGVEVDGHVMVSLEVPELGHASAHYAPEVLIAVGVGVVVLPALPPFYYGRA